MLSDSGFLVVADARLVVPEDPDPFFVEADEDYEAVLGERAQAPGAPALASLSDEMSQSGLFNHIAERRYRWQVVHRAAGYVDLLDTIRWYRALGRSERRELNRRIRRRIDERRGGTVTVTFEAVLDIARETSDARTCSAGR